MWEWKREGKRTVESRRNIRRLEENDEVNERDLSRRCYSQSVSFGNRALLDALVLIARSIHHRIAHRNI